MGKRQRRRSRSGDRPAPESEAIEYADADGNVLALRGALSEATLRKLREPAGPAAASADDLWRRRTEMLFERLSVRWTIAGLSLESQAELVGRYRMADAATQDWVRATLDEHLRRIGVDAA
jgi:hypothetical protein